MMNTRVGRRGGTVCGAYSARQSRQSRMREDQECPAVGSGRLPEPGIRVRFRAVTCMEERGQGSDNTTDAVSSAVTVAPYRYRRDYRLFHRGAHRLQWFFANG